MKFENIRVDDYDYNLSDDKIAKYPAAERDGSKLLTYINGNIKAQKFKNIAEFLQPGDLMVFNETKVIKARMNFKKQTGAKIEVFCLEPGQPADYERAFSAGSGAEWKCTVGNLKKWKKNRIYTTADINGHALTIYAEKVKNVDNTQFVRFLWEDDSVTFGDILGAAGKTPIPPYLNRHSEDSDTERYQTVYSKNKGSVAAPTAGLHFTPEIMQKLTKKNIKSAFVNLHVGAGTFKPVKSETAAGHTMHSEQISISTATITEISENLGHITAVGTTSVRTLESLYWTGVKIITGAMNKLDFLKQNEITQLPQDIETKTAVDALITYMKTNKTERFEFSTQIFIIPGYKFRIISKLITNFHMPKSTLLMLISAFIGKDHKRVYDFALENNFRFLSYGDSSLLIP
ncbi:MAG: S-adenosylmethionine:tRNA ribosyltransferase-isomerase [Bacteroidota bacterium]|nr:S-adenosylmethionine:tRNA ribosyltransferase-isomerase [Bacteroidota bacterium]